MIKEKLNKSIESNIPYERATNFLHFKEVST